MKSCEPSNLRIVTVTEEMLCEVLGLPAGATVLGVNDSKLVDTESRDRVLTLKVILPATSQR